jgi:hypothetical protein
MRDLRAAYSMRGRDIGLNRPLELEITLSRGTDSHYMVGLRLAYSPTEAPINFDPGTLSLDLIALQGQASDAGVYGDYLGTRFFADPRVGTAFDQALARRRGQPLRLRLFVAPTTAELHAVRWETLRRPSSAMPLFTDANLLFSRCLNNLNLPPITLRPKQNLRTLIVIANPTNLANYHLYERPLGAIPVKEEYELIRASLRAGNLAHDVLLSGGRPQSRPTAEQVRKALQHGYDILYLVCHGTRGPDGPTLLLEGEDGMGQPIPGRDVAQWLQDLPEEKRPRLVILASCRSAGDGNSARSADQGLQAALGPILAGTTGIPAVMAMQSDISIGTVSTLMPEFFAELQAHGEVDRALAAARGVVRDRGDWWAPVLFMRLASGHIWAAPQVTVEQPSFARWADLLSDLRAQQCTPILGPGLLEEVLGPFPAVAQRWAEQENYPLAPHKREQLPHIAQFVLTQHNLTYLRRTLRDELRSTLYQQYAPQIPGLEAHASLPALLQRVGAYRREQHPTDPYRVLATLPVTTYITASPDNLLAEALAAAGRPPEVLFCPWKDELARAFPLRAPTVEPDAAHPLIFQLFGCYDKPETLVLTEDDYFDYLIGVTEDRKSVSELVGGAIGDAALLFLGFQLDDWEFRVLFRSLVSKPGWKKSQEHSHVAVQIDLAKSHITDPVRARQYLETYFEQTQVFIYWGSVESFIQELQERWQAYQAQTAGGRG